jgi:hypothetical protein
VSLVSAVLTPLGLLAVSLSLVYQAHQTKIAMMIGSRERHFELMRLMREFPALDFNNVGDWDKAGDEHLVGMSMWMAHWNTMWHIKKMDEEFIRRVSAELFRRASAREWWMKVNATW